MKVVPPAVPHVPGTWRVLYFDAPTRGEQVRMLLVLANVEFHDVRLAFPEGLGPYKKAAMADASPLLGTDMCPAVTAPDGTHCIETSDIMRFIGQRVGLAPKTDSAEDKTAMDVCLLAQETMNQVFYPLFKPMIVKKIMPLSLVQYAIIGRASTYEPQPSAVLLEHLSRYEAALDASGGPYMCGAKPTYADASVFAILNEILAYKCFDRAALLEGKPKLARLLSTLGEQMQGWIDYRVREHQCGIRDTVEFLAATNTPLPWAKVTKPAPETPEFVVPAMLRS